MDFVKGILLSLRDAAVEHCSSESEIFSCLTPSWV